MNVFFPVLVIDIESDLSASKAEMLVHLPAIPSRGDTIAFEAAYQGDRADAVVVDVAYYTRESSPTPLDAYIHVFVSYTRSRRDIQKEDQGK